MGTSLKSSSGLNNGIFSVGDNDLSLIASIVSVSKSQQDKIIYSLYTQPKKSVTTQIISEIIK